ncbi:flippase [Methylocaldum szegediense]|uniref:Polysaccharide biosynthesis protein n=1 Tax=Methylocaldum szegediense TaxID=73780 RepID=A0ABM9I6L9_9GAMM|nr:flippase [Methylocaldum szegediense]CAI8927004.1 conserved membrane protein of unknown function [Methylocaldum szegediense]
MSIAKSTLANLAGAFTPLIITLVSVPHYLRLIGEERYGTLAVIWSLLAYFVFFDFGLGRALAQRMARLGKAGDRERSDLLWTALLVSLPLSSSGGLILWISAEWILVHVVGMTPTHCKEALSAIPWLAPTLPLLICGSVLQGALHARERFVASNVASVVGNGFSQLVPLLIAMLGYRDLGSLVPAALSGRLITVTLLGAMCWRYVPLRVRANFQRSHVKPLLSYGGWSSAASMVAPFLVTVDRMVIGAMGGAASIAYYTIPYNVAAPLTLISHSLTVALFPRLAATSSANARCISADATRNLVAVMTPIVIGALAVAHPFLALWVGQEFAASANGVSELILLGVWTNSTVVAHFSRLQATGRVKTIFFTYLIEIPIYFLFLWVGLRTWGVLGAAAAWSLRVLLDAVLLLSVGGAFWQTVKDTFPAMALVVTSWGLVTFVDFYSPLRWVGLLILMALSMALNFPLIKRVSALAFSR